MDIKNIAPPDKWTYVVNRKTGEVNYVNTEIKMNFIEAVKLLKLDKNIKLMRRAKDFEITLTGKGYFDMGNKYLYFTPLLEDILATDWYVVKNEKLHTFEEALKAYKSGKNIKRKGDETIYRYRDYREFDSYDVMANDWIILDKEVIK